MATDLTVANTILDQMGGSGRLASMIGVYNLTGTENALTFRFKARAKNGSNCVRITLEPSDTYKVEFISIRGRSVKVKSTHEDIYCDVLRELFERETGLYLSLGRVISA
jgi:hypothetical protein